MDWSDVRIFLAIVRTGTLGGAARSLHLSHPTIGRRLQALEQATGQVLFQRTAEGLVLTDEGAAIVSLAEQMEEGALTIARRLAGDAQELEGTLRISSADWFGAFVLPRVVAEFGQTYPHVVVELLTGSRLFNLAQREADIAFRIVPFDSADIVQRKLVGMRYAAYVAAQGEDPKIGDGAGQALIVMDRSTGEFPDIAWLRTQFPNARIGLRSNNRNVQSQMCRNGLGIAVLPRPVGDSVPGLRRLALEEEPPEWAIWMGYHRDLKRLARLRAFIKLVVEHLAT